MAMRRAGLRCTVWARPLDSAKSDWLVALVNMGAQCRTPAHKRLRAQTISTHTHTQGTCARNETMIRTHARTHRHTGAQHSRSHSRTG